MAYNLVKCNSSWKCFIRLVITNTIGLKDDILVSKNVLSLSNKTEVENTSNMVLSGLEMTCYSGEGCIPNQPGFPNLASPYGCRPSVERANFY